MSHEDIKFVRSIRIDPDKIKFIKPKDQIFYMIENALLQEKRYHLLDYCNHTLLNESFILKLVPMTDSIHIIENFTNHVPDEFLKVSFFQKK